MKQYYAIKSRYGLNVANSPYELHVFASKVARDAWVAENDLDNGNYVADVVSANSPEVREVKKEAELHRTTIDALPIVTVHKA